MGLSPWKKKKSLSQLELSILFNFQQIMYPSKADSAFTFGMPKSHGSVKIHSESAQTFPFCYYFWTQGTNHELSSKNSHSNTEIVTVAESVDTFGGLKTEDTVAYYCDCIAAETLNVNYHQKASLKKPLENCPALK